MVSKDTMVYIYKPKYIDIDQIRPKKCLILIVLYLPELYKLEGWQSLLHGQLEQDFQIANLSSCQEGWQDLLHGQLEQDFQIANLSSCQEGWQDLLHGQLGQDFQIANLSSCQPSQP